MSERRSEIAAALLRARRLLAHLALISGVINLLMLVPAIYMLQVFDRVLTSRSGATLAMLTLILVAFFALGGLLDWIRSQILARIGASLECELGPRVFGASFERNLAAPQANPAQLFADLALLRQFAAGPALVALLDAPWLPIYLAAAWLFHTWLGALAVVGMLILLVLAIANERATRSSLAAANQHALAAAAELNGSLRHAQTIQALGMLGAMRSRWATRAERVRGAQLTAGDRGAGISAATRSVRGAWQSLALGLGALLVLRHEISAGEMIAVSVLLGRALAPVELLIGSWRQFGNAHLAYQRLSRLLAHHPIEPARMPLPAPTGALCVDALVLTPPGAQQPALSGISFSLAAGEVLAVIGPSASGKTTLARALTGIWPATSGCIRLDDADLALWPREALGPKLGYLPQAIELFEGSVAENIARFGEVDSEQVIEAARLAGIHEQVLHLPQGYDTQVGSGGCVLSGGQQQRLGLARALYRRPALIVLDEPNSNLDEAGEAALVRAIAAVKAAGSTVVVITHRPSVLGVVDKLLFLIQASQRYFGAKEPALRALLAPARRAPPVEAERPEAAA